MIILRHSCVIYYHRWLVNFLRCQRLHVDRCCLQKKKKWTKDKISALAAWNYETNVICGPKKARNTISKEKRVRTHDICVDYSQLNNSQVAGEVGPSKLEADELQMLDMPCSTTKRLSSRTVLEDSVQKPKSPAVNNLFKLHGHIPAVTEKRQTGSNIVSKHENEDDFVTTKRVGTCGYTWVDSPAQTLPADGRENTGASYSQTTSADSDNVVQNVVHVSSRVTDASSNNIDIGEQQTVDNSSATESRMDENPAPKNSSDQYILSFPLFAGPVLPPETGCLSFRLPSVSAILKATMPPENQLALTRWEQRMIAELGEDGFKEYQKALFANGSNLHTNIHQYLAGKPEDELVLLPANRGHWQSIESVLADITDVVCLEKPVRHTHLQYCGVLDCVAEYRGVKHVIDWKTSKRRKSSIQDTFDNPLQLVAYLGAYNVQSASLQVERCLLVIGYEDGSAADVHVMDKRDCLRYWSNWLQRLHLYGAGTQS